jgi:phage baseplate assembly protein W
MADSTFLGIAYPFQAGATSLPAEADDDTLIRDSLIQLIMTAKGERVNRPELGTDAFSFVFEDNDDLLSAAIRNTISNAIVTYEPRVIIQNIDVQRHRNEGTGTYLDTVVVTVFYVVRSTQTQGQVSVALGENQGVT